jgi:predicted DNA binding CopG/RHH family protein
MTSELQKTLEEISEVEVQLHQSVENFKPAIADFLRETYEKQARYYVEKESSLTVSLPKETLAEIKSKVAQLMSDAEKITEEYFGNIIKWWIPDGKGDQYSYSTPIKTTRDAIEKQLRLAIGLVGPVLEIGGYLSTKTNTQAEKDVWCEYDQSGNRHLSNGRPRYPYALTFTKEMQDALKRYSTLAESLHKLIHKKISIEKKISQKTAASLWDSAL